MTESQGVAPSLVVRAARWSARHPRKAIIGWLLFVVACFGVGTAVGTNRPNAEDFFVGEAGHAEAMAGSVARPLVENVIVKPVDGKAGGADARQAGTAIAARMQQLSEVASVTGPFSSPSSDAQLVRITLHGGERQAKEHVESLLTVTRKAQVAHPELRIAQSGGGSISQGINVQLGSDLLRSEALTLPVTLVILVVVFGAILVAGVPLILAASSIFAALGLYAFASYLVPDAGGAVHSVIAMMGMAVGVDYSLLYLKRVREERAKRGAVDPIAIASATAGRAVLISGLAAVVSLTGLYLADDVVFSALATGMILVVGVAMASTLTVLPAFVAKLGSRVDARRLNRVFRRGRKDNAPAARETMLTRPAARHPAATLLVAGGLLVALAVPALTMQLRVEGDDTFPRSVPAVQAYHDTFRSFPWSGPSHQVVLRSESGHAATALHALADAARSDSHFAAAPPRVDQLRVAESGKLAALDLPVPYATSSARAEQSLHYLRTKLAPRVLGDMPGVKYATTGDVARNVDYADHQAQHLPLVLAGVLLMTALVMLVAFRSVPVALISVLLSALSVLASWGAMTVVFQSALAHTLLGAESSGFITARTPLMVFAILFGLSTDYQVFVVSRIRERLRDGLPAVDAVVTGLRSTAGVITSAAIVMMSVFLTFVFIDRLVMLQLGFALTLGVLLDAVIVRTMLLPAALRLLGDKAWWPIRKSQHADLTEPMTVHPATFRR